MSQNKEVFSLPNHLFPPQKGRKDLVNTVKVLSAHKRGAQTSTRGLGSSMQKPAPFTVQHSRMQNCSLLWTRYGSKTCFTHRCLSAETRAVAGLLAFLLSWGRDGIFLLSGSWVGWCRTEPTSSSVRTYYRVWGRENMKSKLIWAS